MRWKRNGDGGVAPKGRTRYFLLQPSLPLNQATWLGARPVLKHWRVPLTHFFLPVFFGFFLRLVFLPFAIFGRILRTRSMSSSLQA